MTIEQIDNKINATNIEIGGIKTDLNRISYRAGARRLTNAEMNEIAKLEGLKAEKEAKIRRLEFQRMALEFEEQYGYSMEESLRSGSSRNSTTNNYASENNSSLNSNDNSNGRGFKAAVITSLTAIAVLLAIIAFSPSKNKGGSLLPSPSPTATATLDPKEVFSEISKSEVLERAQYIYDNDLTAAVKKYTTVEEIADLIAIKLGQLPIYGSGSLDNAIDDSMQESIQIFGNWDGLSGIVIPEVHYALQAPDGSDLSKFMSKYDELYNNIAVGRNANDPDKVISNIQKLATMQYYDYVFTDTYSNSTNFADEEFQAGMLGAVLERYPNYVSEYIKSNKLVICVPVCLNQETHEEQMVNVLDIFQAIMNGVSDNKKVTLSSSEGGNPGSLSVSYKEDLLSELEYKEAHELKLK